MHMRDFLPAEICVEMYCQERESIVQSLEVVRRDIVMHVYAV